MASLHVDRGEKKGQVISLDKDKFVLGRSPDCDAVISTHESVSRWHAKIVRIKDRYQIEDLKSRNKTFVNDREVMIGAPVLLRTNDVIRICQFQATFMDSAADDPEAQSDSTVEATLSSSEDHRLEKQPAAKLAGLLEITAKLSKTLQLDAQLPEVADGLLRLFPQADRCFLILAEEETDNLHAKVVRTRVTASEHTARFSHSIVRRCLQTVQAVLVREAGPGTDGTFHSQMRSVMCVPLCPAQGVPFGVIQLDTLEDAKKFAEADLRLLLGVSHQVAVAMENAHFHEARMAQMRVKSELELARQVQLNFLPRRLPELPGYEFYAYYEPAREVGGDYYDFIPMPGNRLTVTIGDVAGKGMPAALLMARLSSEARACLLTEAHAPASFRRLNQQVYPITSSMDRFVSLASATLDPATHTLSLVNAGHPPLLHFRRADGKFSRAIPSEDEGPLLGISEESLYRSYQVALAPGDCMVLFSDGVTDAQSAAGKAFRLKGIHSVLDYDAPATPRALGERIIHAVQRHAFGCDPYDDMTLICFGRR